MTFFPYDGYIIYACMYLMRITMMVLQKCDPDEIHFTSWMQGKFFQKKKYIYLDKLIYKIIIYHKNRDMISLFFKMC